MKFKAKETNRWTDIGETWIIKDKIYDLEERFNGDYIFKSEICDNHVVSKANLNKWFEEVKKPRICELLGVELGEKFNVKERNDRNLIYKTDVFQERSPYKLKKTESDEIELRDKSNYDSPYLLINLIEHPERIEKIPRYTDEQKEIFKALKVLGFNWAARDKSGILYMYNSKPRKGCVSWMKIANEEVLRLNLKVFELVKWEDLEPFEIPNMQ